MKTRWTIALSLLAIPALAQAPSPLPVKQVTLFTSGVAYIERGGEVDGDAALPLMFRTAQINDILKSMVLLDAGGRVQPATYAARDPIGHSLQAFAVDVSQNMSMDQILNRLRGASVEVRTSKAKLIGQIVGVEEREVSGVGDKPISAQFLNLLTENGLMSIKLDPDVTVRLLDNRLEQEFREALHILASGTDEQRRQVTLHFAGNGRRQVRVGYVMEAPLWKMSYRLVLGSSPGKPAAKPYLQGWSLVENTSDEDWQGVRLSLVSGRPVSFIQDLYQPLYLPRPVVGPDVVASPYPQTHGANLEDAEKKVAEAPVNAPLAGAVGGRGGAEFRSNRRASGLGGGGLGMGGEMGDRVESIKAYGLDNSIILRESVAAAAAGQRAGELFQYNISTPVNLPRQQAAMIPVVAQDIDVEKVSIFNADSGGRFPLNAVRIKNTTGLHLKGGPVTLFDEGVYAGDAKMEDIPPGDSRLVSYAVDLSIEGERQNPNSKTIETALNLKRGVLTITRRETIETDYTLKSKADKARNVLIEYPFQAEYKLLAPAKPAERTAELYRFAVTVPPGKSEKLKVVTERPISVTVGILDGDLNVIVFQANRKDISAKMREALQDVIQRRRKVQELQAQAAVKENEVKTFADDQDRIRRNMGALDRTSALYKRYETELDKQETGIQTLRIEATTLRKQAADADRELKAFVDNLTIAE